MVHHPPGDLLRHVIHFFLCPCFFLHCELPNKGKMPKNNRSSAKSTKKEVDILSPAAMENVYYISHNAVECLECRGFGWPNANKKKKKGTKQKKK
uniref:Small lysine rich protein 1 n=1 Tax=Monopterus albus TaxID=43700 RepID=A0A3Q3IX96_MONAL